MKIRYDIPIVVKPNMEIKIGRKIYLLKISGIQIIYISKDIQVNEA
jgi:hypothetical protein